MAGGILRALSRGDVLALPDRRHVQPAAGRDRPRHPLLHAAGQRPGRAPPGAGLPLAVRLACLPEAAWRAAKPGRPAPAPLRTVGHVRRHAERNRVHARRRALGACRAAGPGLGYQRWRPGARMGAVRPLHRLQITMGYRGRSESRPAAGAAARLEIAAHVDPRAVPAQPLHAAARARAAGLSGAALRRCACRFTTRSSALNRP